MAQIARPSARPMFIRRKEGITKLRGVFQRETTAMPINYYSLWIDGQTCNVGISPLAAPTNVQQLLSIDGILDADIALDGSWRAIQPEGYRLVTEGQPYISYVSTNNSLKVERLGESTLEFQGTYSLTAMVRGWKHMSDETIDQGLLVFGLQKDANVIDVYSYKSNLGTFGWTKVMSIDIDFTPTFMTADRLTDFRWSLTISNAEKSQMLISDRTYVSQAVKPESLTLTAIKRNTNVMTVAPIKHLKVEYIEKDVVVLKQITRTTNTVDVCDLVPIKNTWATNVGGTIIQLLWDRKLTVVEGTSKDDMLAGFKISDSAGTNIGLVDVEFTPYGAIFQCTDFNNAVGDITINYIGGYLLWGLNYTQGAFTTTFTPEGLKPTDVDPPVPIRAYRVEVIIDDEV